MDTEWAMWMGFQENYLSYKQDQKPYIPEKKTMISRI